MYAKYFERKLHSSKKTSIKFKQNVKHGQIQLASLKFIQIKYNNRAKILLGMEVL